MANITGLTRGGTAWEARFITAIDQKVCIGCGRCFKACSRDVLELVERESDDDGDDDQAMVMSIKDAMDCIGCEACARVCSKKAISHAPAPLPA